MPLMIFVVKGRRTTTGGASTPIASSPSSTVVIAGVVPATRRMRPHSARRRPDAESDEDVLDEQGDEAEGGEPGATDDALYCFCNEKSYDDWLRQWKLCHPMVPHGLRRSQTTCATRHEVVLFEMQRESRRFGCSGCWYLAAGCIQQACAQKGKTCVSIAVSR
ncbi:hypothetical protein AG1IA_00468 [Rhizoctonia solani AG-1 IA]|uniref:Uncharacterized protein n=1 Tax=Thanatephorus cucumeris (strain AG1-IA) TaxID=983506 RepID=L8X8S7_THACA|nr:hypothetical protein AG1IA_00468 [Rhizoctonia solani AG-1 IA]